MTRGTLITTILLLCCSYLFDLVSSSSADQLCAKYRGFSSNRVFTSCNDLPYLNSFLHWTINPSSGTVQIAYRSSSSTSTSSSTTTTTSRRRWVAWAINPSAKGMAGSQALVAFQKSDGSIKVYTSPVSTTTTGLQEGDLSFPVSDLSVTYSANNKNNEITIFATLKLKPHNLNHSSTAYNNYILNQVWQEGPVSGDTPQIHPTSGPNLNSMATLNLVSGHSEANSNSRIFKKKNIHGVLNAVSWGIMMPAGAIIARYMKVSKRAEPAWFYLHSACQTSAYIMGTLGWATGLQLGTHSTGIQFTLHRTIGIVLFCLATLQVTALLMRPKKENKYRMYWNMYHHVIGYSIIILGIINIFRGLDMILLLNPNNNNWKRAYVGVIVTLAVIAIFLEVITWIIVLRRRKRKSADAQATTITTGGEKMMAAAHPNNGTRNGFHQYYAAAAATTEGGTRTQSYAAATSHV